MDFAALYVLKRWDMLRALPKGMGLDPADPLAQSRPPLVKFRPEVHEEPMRPRPLPPLDHGDDIPF